MHATFFVECHSWYLASQGDDFVEMLTSLLHQDILCFRCWRGHVGMIGKALPESFGMKVFGEEDECEVSSLVL